MRKKVLVHGCFDVLHFGHLQHLRAAKKHGDYLVVSVTADRFVNKGPGKPVFSAEVRAEMLRSLSIVDEVIISDYPTAVQVIENIKPAIYAKGSDYKDRTKDITKEIYNEEAAVKKHGGELIFTDEETFSSSTLANRFLTPWSDTQSKCIARIKELGGIDKIESLLESISKLTVAMIGEPICDVYRFVEPQNISSKSPSISAKFLYEETYQGGAMAIANHLLDFVSHVNFPKPFEHGQMPTKIRYISVDKSQRIFEVTHIDESIWLKDLSIPEADVTILADFGHGLFDRELLKRCEQIKGFVALNVQTNSSNLPFNPYHKHERFDYLSIDSREMRIAFHDKDADPVKLTHKAMLQSECPISLTLGSNGAYFIRRDNDYFAPAFADQVIDATGAGDAYFAITSLLVKVGAPPEMVPFLGNVFAGLKTKIVGNKFPVTKAQFIKACQGILK